ncbi:MAG: 23S rRNA (guanosine(2251)-2'-O)-methyltransferase RlmB [Eubacteriales bacterium]|nr:23S rRNA (guanosine(2251)-2'-O)-methyltransferase RlmB [Eubacteriales bacterium]
MKIKGRNAVREALNSDVNIIRIMVSNSSKDKVLLDIVSLAKKKGVKIQYLDNKILDKECDNNQGIIADTSDFKYSTVEDILQLAKDKNKNNFILILDGIEDPHNFGSIIRVAECLGVDGIIISKNRACPVNDTVSKVSAGAIEHVKIAKVTNINTEIERLKQNNIWVYACELGGEDLDSADLSGNIAVVVGSEGDGVSRLTRKICDGVVSMQMYGKVNSLNVSVATGIVLYEIVRKNRS